MASQEDSWPPLLIGRAPFFAECAGRPAKGAAQEAQGTAFRNRHRIWAELGPPRATGGWLAAVR